jgi:hypothetical protein
LYLHKKSTLQQVELVQTMAADNSPSTVLYDIAYQKPYPESTCAPNPWKARYALNFKAIPYSTRWVLMPDIAQVRRGLDIPAGRNFADGTEFYTLPIVTDAKTGAKLGDTLDIANWLQDTFPSAGAGDLFPSQDLTYDCPGIMIVPLSEPKDNIHADYAKFNHSVDNAFTLHTQLAAEGQRWDPELVDGIRAEMTRRTGMSWEQIAVRGEARVKLMASLHDTLRDLAALFQRDTTGPFLLGTKPNYADIIVGGWLRMFSMTVLDSEWEEIQGWHGGVFGKLHAALQERFGDVK